MRIIKWLHKILKHHLAKSTTDPVIWEVVKRRNKQGKKCYLAAEWKNDV